MNNTLSRRALIGRALQSAAVLSLAPQFGCRTISVLDSPGRVIGQPGAEEVGDQILADGGNAFDAIAAAALVGAVTQPHQTGVGGYAAHAMLAYDGGRRLAALDANSTAPAAMTADIFKPGADGSVPGRVNEYGWLASGVPGVIAGLHLIVRKFGSRPFSAALEPATRLVGDGFKLSPSSANAIKGAATQLAKDPGSAKIYLRDGKPPAAGDTFKNPELAVVLETLARANSVEPFYRGDIAQRIAEGFQKNGGLVTAKDLAAYSARLVEPISLKWGEHTIHTVPLTCGGLTVLQMLSLLRALGWEKMPAGLARTHTQVEAMRLAWRDRLTLLGDPEFVKVPQARLLSDDYAHESADKVRVAVKSGKPLAHAVAARDHSGTLSFSAADRHGNFAALTLTHGNGFGARVSVDGLGLTLGHGMSRFDPDPTHPNAPAPGKRPLHNMAPVIVTRSGRPVLAVGGRGGRKIPNSVLEFLLHAVVRGEPLDTATRAPRIHTEGTSAVEFEQAWPAVEAAALKRLGYTVKTAGAATLSAVALEDGELRAAMR